MALCVMAFQDSTLAFSWEKMMKTKRNKLYLGADKSLARPTSRCSLFDGQNISFDASLVICTCI